MSEPKANKKTFYHEYHGKKYLDDYHWLKDPNIIKTKNPEIISYLEEENVYTKNFFDSKLALLDDIYNELLGRIKLEDETVPIEIEEYKYFSKIKQNQNYYVHLRLNSKNGREEVVLDENKLAISDYLSIGSASVSPNHKFIAYSLDRIGNERYLLKIRDIEKDKDLDIEIDNVVDDIVWNKDSTGIYYVIPDDAWRPYKVMFFNMIENTTTEILHEKDEKFRLEIAESSDKNFLLIRASSSLAHEYYVRKLDIKDGLEKIYDRNKNSRISLDHCNNAFYALVNDTGKNFRLIKIIENKIEEIIPSDDKVYLKNMVLFDGVIIIHYRKEGLDYIKYSKNDGKTWFNIDFNQESYALSLIPTYYKNRSIRYSYSSLNTPNQVREFDLEKSSDILLKEQEIPSGFDSKQYTVKREFAKSQDGVNIPLSIVYKTDLIKHDGDNPVYLYGYGSYGLSTSPRFNSNVISLLNRGFVYVIAHIRGGDDMGFDWYETSKFTTKWNSFNDFIASANYLIERKYTQINNITIMGGSAGGMLVGTVLNKESSLFKNVIAHVPFVDVINTMMDDSLPLTIGEYLEWGDPNQKEYFDYIMSYSPYNNLKPINYPNIYATTSLGDPRVGYWEAAKWIAKIRDIKSNNPLILLDINMEAGHAGASGRFGYLKDKAKEYVFVLSTYNISH